MNSKQRVRAAMELQEPDQVPVFCQLSAGHYMLHSGLPAIDVWFDPETWAEAQVRLQQRYGFDGILVNLPGRPSSWDTFIDRVDEGAGEQLVWWKNGNFSKVPHDDNAHYYQADGSRYFPTFEEVDPGKLYYAEPWDISDITYPYTWGFEDEPRPFEDFFPDYLEDTLRLVIAKAGPDVSIHAEVFSPFSQFLELLNYETALMALLDDPGKTKDCLQALTRGAIDLGCRRIALGADALLVSSAFAGNGFLSREHYEEFVLPYEKQVVDGVKKTYPEIPVYIHTCGGIGDRLDLQMKAGFNGIDTLDPPPLGTVELPEARDQTRGKAFIKGNLDPVNTLLLGDRETVREAVEDRIRICKPGGGYILSTACSVAPPTKPELIEFMTELGHQHGRY